MKLGKIERVALREGGKPDEYGRTTDLAAIEAHVARCIVDSD